MRPTEHFFYTALLWSFHCGDNASSWKERGRYYSLGIDVWFSSLHGTKLVGNAVSSRADFPHKAIVLCGFLKDHTALNHFLKLFESLPRSFRGRLNSLGRCMGWSKCLSTITIWWVWVLSKQKGKSQG